MDLKGIDELPDLQPNLSQTDLRMVMMAVEIAASSKCRQQVGAVMVDHRGITTATNRDHRWGGKLFPWSVHAEMAVLKGHTKRGGRLYVARVTPGGFIGMAKPCPRCAKTLQEAGVSRAIWTATDTLVAQARCRDLSIDVEKYYTPPEGQATLKRTG